MIEPWSTEKVMNDVSWKGDMYKVPITYSARGTEMVTCRLNGQRKRYIDSCYVCYLRTFTHYSKDEHYVACKSLKPGQTFEEALRENEERRTNENQ